MDEMLKTTLAATQARDSLGVQWFLGGSLASSLMGIPRATLDANIVADISEQHVKPLLHALGDAWYADESAVREAIASRSCFNLIHFETAMKVDVFVPKRRNFETRQFKHLTRIPVSDDGESEIPVCSAEDIIAAKLEWFHLGGRLSERQWGDIMGVIRLNAGRLDLQRLRENAKELEVEDLLETALGSE